MGETYGFTEIGYRVFALWFDWARNRHLDIYKGTDGNSFYWKSDQPSLTDDNIKFLLEQPLESIPVVDSGLLIRKAFEEMRADCRKQLLPKLPERFGLSEEECQKVQLSFYPSDEVTSHDLTKKERQVADRVSWAEYSLATEGWDNLSEVERQLIGLLPAKRRSEAERKSRIEALAIKQANEELGETSTIDEVRSKSQLSHDMRRVWFPSVGNESTVLGEWRQGKYHQMAEEALAEEERAVARNQQVQDEFINPGAIFVSGFSGSGKSFVLARLCIEKLKRGIGQVVIDPVGGLTTELLSRIMRDAPELEEKLVYCPMAGMWVENEIYVPSWPMLWRQFEHEALFETANRFVDVTARVESSFKSAPIQGLSRFSNILINLNMVLGSFGLPLSAAIDLLRNHAEERWQLLLTRAAGHSDSGVRFAVSELQHHFGQLPHVQDQQTEPLINRLAFLWQDEVSQIMFGNDEPTVDLDAIARDGKLALIDFSAAFTGRIPELRLFWVWSQLQEWIANRDANREENPLSVVIDELSFLVSGSHLDVERIVDEFNAFIQQRRRNSNIHFAGATQELSLLPESMQKACLMIPSQMYGATTDLETAYRLADRFYELDPFLLKQEMMKPSQVQTGMTRTGRPMYSPGDPYVARQDMYSFDEQRYLNALNFIKLEEGEWLFGAAEGNAPAKTLEKISIAREAGHTERGMITQTKQRLAKWHGIPVKETVRKRVVKPVVRKEVRKPDKQPQEVTQPVAKPVQKNFLEGRRGIRRS